MKLPPAIDQQKPGVSVALCTYNGERYLPEQLDSISRQDHLPQELVVCDDRSTDATVSLLEAFAREAPFPMRIVRNERNLGSTHNFGQAIGLCRGEFISLCDQDDVWLTDKLASCTDFLREHPACLAVFTEATVVDQTLHPLDGGTSLWERFGLSHDVLARLVDPSTSLRTLGSSFFVTGATLVMRRELVHHALPIPERLSPKMLHDGWLAVVAAALGGLGGMARSTLLYRQHPAQQVGASPQVPHRKLAPREKFRRLAADLERLYDLLAERVGDRAVPGVLDELACRAAHFRRRGDLSESRLQRVQPVVAEWRRRGYHRFCQHPVFSALRDVAV